MTGRRVPQVPGPQGQVFVCGVEIWILRPGIRKPLWRRFPTFRTVGAPKASRRDDTKVAPGEPEAQRRGNPGLAAKNDLGVP